MSVSTPFIQFIESLRLAMEETGETYTRQEILQASIRFLEGLEQSENVIENLNDEAEFENHLTSLQLIYGPCVDESEMSSKKNNTPLLG